MPDIEIERKFLVAVSPVDSNSSAGTPITQGYLSAEGEYSVRIRMTTEGCYLTAKSRNVGIERLEVECEVPRLIAEALMVHCLGRIVSKVRYPLVDNDRLWVIDVFGGANRGLIVAETEFERPDEHVEVPSWCGAEVTDDPRFYNEYLADHPYTGWPTED